MFNIDEIFKIIIRIKSTRTVLKRLITRKKRRRVFKIEKNEEKENRFDLNRLNSNYDE